MSKKSDKMIIRLNTFDLTALYKLILIPMTLSLAACGGGDDEGSSLSEAAAQYGIQMVNADDVNDLGGTGAGVNVAVVDTGLNSNHAEFSGRVVRGTDFTDTPGNNWQDDNNLFTHGTAVAGVIGANRDSQGMRGIAYDSNLFGYRVDNNDGFSALETSAGWVAMVEQHGVDQIQFSNNSWGSCHIDDPDCSDFYLNEYGIDEVIDAYRDEIEGVNGTVFVWAAGNIDHELGETRGDDTDNPAFEAGLPFLPSASDLASNWLAVASVDENGRESEFTYRCGVAAAWCVTAPGEDILTVDGDGGYQNISGTSFSAPMVTGVLAALSDLHPELTGAQIVERVKFTSTYAGLSTFEGAAASSLSQAEREAIFGHGLVDALAAQNEIGTLSVPVAATASGQTVALSGMSMPRGLSSSGRKALRNTRVTALDSFDQASFSVSGAELFEEDELDSRSIGYSGQVLNQAPLVSEVDQDIADSISFAHAYAPQGVSVASLNFWGDKTGLVKDLDRGNQFLDTMQVSYELNETLTLASSVDYSEVTNETGFGLTASLHFDGGTSLMAGMSQGTYIEDMTGVSNRNLSLSDVRNYEIGIRHALTDSIELFGHAQMREMSDVSASTTSWGTQDATFGSAVVGAEYSGIDHKLSLGVYQPDQQFDGDATILLASGRNRDGAIFYREEAFDAAGDAELGLFLAGKWDFLADGMGELSFQMQQTPGDVSKVNEAAVMVNLRF